MTAKCLDASGGKEKLCALVLIRWMGAWVSFRFRLGFVLRPFTTFCLLPLGQLAMSPGRFGNILLTLLRTLLAFQYMVQDSFFYIGTG